MIPKTNAPVRIVNQLPAKPKKPRRPRSPRQRSDTGRARLAVAALAFLMVYAVIGARLMTYAMDADGLAFADRRGSTGESAARPDLVDRNGQILATDLISPSLYAEPNKILNLDDAVDKLSAVLPDLGTEELTEKLGSDRKFIWLKRDLTPRQEAAVHDLGLPGLGFRRETRRVYPSGRTASHILGAVNVDNRGIAGIEKYIDDQGLAELHGLGFATDHNQMPVALSIDLRAQHAMRHELVAAMEKFRAKAASGILMDVHTGEVVSMVSLPDYDPNDPETALRPEAINRLTTGVYEMGSTFKTMTVAMALDTGRITLEDRYDARRPLRVANFTINDYHAQRRILTVPEIFVYSSNIGSARMALDVGIDGQKEFLKRLGMLDRMETELPENAAPLYPHEWKQLSAMTIAFGHGISIAPIQLATAAVAMANGGTYIPPTFLKRSRADAEKLGHPVLRHETSEAMRYLMRLNVERGTARKADRLGYRLGGKTGTAEKAINGRYAKNKLLTSFLGTFPTDDPRYVILVVLDEPKGSEETHGYATSGWNAAPTAGNIVERVAPILGVLPRVEEGEPEDSAIFVSY
ncbi:MAG: penicillin-binding protein 2 [Rhodobiaceae bacterium]|nr:penicillin-binding protein 2 [Rhodobiaceae bacterium]